LQQGCKNELGADKQEERNEADRNALRSVAWDMAASHDKSCSKISCGRHKGGFQKFSPANAEARHKEWHPDRSKDKACAEYETKVRQAG
jgi:hypothetical protein